MSTFFFRNPRMVALVVLLILAIGISGLTSNGRQEDPTITNIFATVVTALPGADPGLVEALVTEKIEDELERIPEIKEIRSTSRSGLSLVRIELAWELGHTEIEQIWSEIRDALSDGRRELPGRGVGPGV